jgi:PleD family two-component response regulator
MTEAQWAPIRASVSSILGRGAVTIGLVEDDPDQAALYAQWLTEAGYRVRRYGTAAEFRRRLGAESIDGLLLDWMLPDASGRNSQWVPFGAGPCRCCS